MANLAPNNAASGIMNIDAQPVDAGAYLFLGVSGTVTVRGYFVDQYGAQTGIAYTGTVAIAGGGTDPKDFLALWGLTAYPSGQYGVRFATSGDAWHSTGGNTAAVIADFKANYAKYTKLAGNDYYYTAGKVG